MDPLTALRERREEAAAATAAAAAVAPSSAGGAAARKGGETRRALSSPTKRFSGADHLSPPALGLLTTGGSAPSSSSPPAAAQSLLQSPRGSRRNAGTGRAPPEPPHEEPIAMVPDALRGERLHMKLRCRLHSANSTTCDVLGDLLLTSYRLAFLPSRDEPIEELAWMLQAKMFDVAVGVVEDASRQTHHGDWTPEKGLPRHGGKKQKVKISTKDFRCLLFILDAEPEAQGLVGALLALAQPCSDRRLFAFPHAEETWVCQAAAPLSPDRTIYDPLQECARMGIATEHFQNPGSPWHLWRANADYGLCSSYPEWLVFPRDITREDLRAVANFRRRGRVPTLSWCGGPDLSYASIWRCSQPLEGWRGSRCPEDERLLVSIRQGARSSRELLVIDLRTGTRALMNKVGGGGFTEYEGCRLVFGGVDNIHAVRDAWKAMGAAVANVVDGEVGAWLKDVADSRWYDYLGALLRCSLMAVKEVYEHRSSVLMHCSDGWDRTSQSVSLAALCLDASHRTRIGFLRLVQRDFCCFGHPFRKRLALGQPVDSEFCPVLIQWLECVYQIVDQYPWEFEFTPGLLLRLATEALTNRYGSLFCDTEQERQREVAHFTLSLWSVLLQPPEPPASTDVNPHYRPSPRPIMPVVSQVRCRVWEEYWFRFHPHGHRPGAARDRGPAARGPAADWESDCSGSPGGRRRWCDEVAAAASDDVSP